MFEIVAAEISFCTQPFATPLKLSSGSMESLTQATASVTLQFGGRRVIGRGTTYLADLWAWPDTSLSHGKRDAVMRQLCEKLASEIPAYFRGQRNHPLEAGLQLHRFACEELAIEPSPPKLARAVCASPFDAAIHDAAGLAGGRSAFALYDDPVPLPSADRYFPEGGACGAIRDVIRPPQLKLPAWYVVGMDDRLETTMVPAIRCNGYSRFKMKLTGRNIERDALRTVELYRSASAAGAKEVRIVGDSNEASVSVESVVEYLERIRSLDHDALRATAYLEQPTDRDIRQHPFDWRPVAKYVPIFVDEALTGLELLPEVKRQGYSGLALKTCKGHSMMLACAAWATQNGLLISLQDLTNPGIAAIH